MIPTCKLCGAQLPRLPSDAAALDRAVGAVSYGRCDRHPVGIQPAPNPGQDLGAASRDPKPCCKRIRSARGYGFCQLQDGHDRGIDPQPCFTVFISEDPLPEEFGPASGKRRRF